jgi:hypothetical protein
MRPESSGAFKIKVTNRGAFSGRLTIQNKRYSWHGRLDHTGFARIPVLRRPIRPVVVTLNLDLIGMDGISGEVTDGDWISELRGFRASPGIINSDLRGKKILFDLINGDESFGSGTVQLNTMPKIRGRLSNGESLAHALTLYENGQSPFYFALSEGRAVLLGWMTLQNGPPPIVFGEFVFGTTNGFSEVIDMSPPK